MQTAKAQISLRILAVQSRSSLSANRFICYYRMCEWRAKARMKLCAHAWWFKPAHFALVWRYVFAWLGPILFKPLYDQHMANQQTIIENIVGYPPGPSFSKLNGVVSYHDVKISILKYGKCIDILPKKKATHIFAAKISMYLKIP